METLRAARLAVPRRAALSDEAGGHAGVWRLGALLGQGGMGTVYLAERRGEGFEQRGALKLLHAAVSDAPALERFLAERRIVARLEHPSIARLIDAGATDAGRPFLVLEYVDGPSLTAYADRRDLAVPERLALFLQVCDAVQYAHQQLVVHCDLKPANILVGADGRPRLLDFGVATAPGAQISRWLTPTYASPEQLAGGLAGTATDVFALGVILHELLTGCLPWPFTGHDLQAYAAARRAAAPVAPSRAAARPISYRYRRELDAIVARALAEEPAARYGTVAQLTEDVRLALACRPVSARARTPFYRARKFLCRNRYPAAAAVLGVVGLVASLFVAVRAARAAEAGRRAAETARAQERAATGFLMRLFEPDAATSGAQVGQLLRRGIARADELADDPLAQARALDLVGRAHTHFAAYATAESLLTRALAIRARQLPAADVAVLATLNELGELRNLRGDYAGASGVFRAVLERALAGPVLAIEAARAEAGLARIAVVHGRLAEAESLLTSALQRRRTMLGATHPETEAVLLTLATTFRWSRQHERAEGLIAAHRARIEAEFGREHLRAAGALLPHAEQQLAVGRYADAERLFRRALAIQRRALGDRHPQLVRGLHGLARARASGGAGAEARQLLEESIAILRDALGDGHPRTAEALSLLGGLKWRRLGDHAGALADYRAAAAVLASRRGTAHLGTLSVHIEEALALADAGRRGEALARVDSLVAVQRTRFAPDSPNVQRLLALREEIRQGRRPPGGSGF